MLPPSYRELVLAKDSPIAEFYPAFYSLDPNGKAQEYKAVALIPFIDEARLLDAVEQASKRLTPAEARRNAQRHYMRLFVPAAHAQRQALLDALQLPDAGFQPIDEGCGALQGLVMPPTAPEPTAEQGLGPGEERGQAGGRGEAEGALQTPEGEACREPPLVMEFLDPPIPPEAQVHRLLPGVTLPPNVFYPPNPEPQGGLTGIGYFHCALALLLYGVVVALEVGKGLESVAGLCRTGAAALFYVACGLLITPQQSLRAFAPQRPPDRPRRLKFLQVGPSPRISVVRVTRDGGKDRGRGTRDTCRDRGRQVEMEMEIEVTDVQVETEVELEVQEVGMSR